MEEFKHATASLTNGFTDQLPLFEILSPRHRAIIYNRMIKSFCFDALTLCLIGGWHLARAYTCMGPRYASKCDSFCFCRIILQYRFAICDGINLMPSKMIRYTFHVQSGLNVNSIQFCGEQKPRVYI